MICTKCNCDITEEMLQAGLCFSCGEDLGESISKYNEEREILLAENRKQNWSEERKEKERKKEKCKEIIITTASFLEGYEVEEQLGLVFGETFLKIGMKNALDMYEKDSDAMLNSGDNELLGSVLNIEKAKNMAIEKIKCDAVNKGANAIIAFKIADNSQISYMTGTYCHSSVYGTAVHVRKRTIS